LNNNKVDCGATALIAQHHSDNWGLVEQICRVGWANSYNTDNLDLTAI